MAVRSLNKVQLIGNLTRDPELRYTPSGTPVATFTVATNREWTVESGEKREEAEFTRCVAWNKLAELCSQLLQKGRKVYVEGRLQTRTWTGQDGQQRTTTEAVINDMILLDSKRMETEVRESEAVPTTQAGATTGQVSDTSKTKKKVKEEVKEGRKEQVSKKEKPEATKETETKEEVNPDDIPF